MATVPEDDHPSDLMTPMSRLLGKEDRISDLIAFLATLDPIPLATALGISSTGTLTSHREVPITGGRPDLMIRCDDVDVALIELKLSASQHGQQYSAYETWAMDQRPPVAHYIASLDNDVEGIGPSWISLDLDVLVYSWEDSGHPHARWLGRIAGGTLKTWKKEVDGPIGSATNKIVADLITRRLVGELNSSLGDDSAQAFRTSGGLPMLTLSRPIAGGPADCRLVIDVRSTSRSDAAAPWIFRSGVEVGVENRTPQEARVLAHDLALDIETALSLRALQDALDGSGRSDLRAALTAGRGAADGMKMTDAGSLSSWRTKALVEDRVSAHPRMFHDWGRRLASQLRVNVVGLDRHGLAAIIRARMELLSAHHFNLPREAAGTGER
ncbi:hypothetical protein D1871_22155 [Nakamurella silvestris]|nr:hypothetical protein D1871_22155 [Nakamurella silvestris]